MFYLRQQTAGEATRRMRMSHPARQATRTGDLAKRRGLPAHSPHASEFICSHLTLFHKTNEMKSKNKHNNRDKTMD